MTRIRGVDLRVVREEFCLVAGLRFGPKIDLSFKDEDFRRRVFPPEIDGASITVGHLYAKITSVEFLTMDHRDVLKLCLLGILICMFLGRYFAYVVPKFLFNLIDNLEAWNLFSWGTFSSLILNEILTPDHIEKELVVDVALTNNLLFVLNRYLNQMCSSGPEMVRVESLLDHPFIKYDFNTLQRTTLADMSNSNNLVAARNELLRTIAEKKEMINII
nr:phospholipase-like protein [Tanacetum cinerariifolium]